MLNSEPDFTNADASLPSPSSHIEPDALERSDGSLQSNETLDPARPTKRPSLELLPYKGKLPLTLKGEPPFKSAPVEGPPPDMKLLPAPVTSGCEALISSVAFAQPSLGSNRSNRDSQDDWPYYHDWKVILRNHSSNQVVLYNQRNHELAISPGKGLIKQFENGAGTESESVDSFASSPTFGSHDAIRKRQSFDQPHDFMDSNYFRWLAINHSRNQGRLLSDDNALPFSAPGNDPPNVLNEAAFNQGGNVYLCQHVLDEIQLGKYAVKKVAIGNDHSWLARMLKEVHMLERLQHNNIIDYKHAWLENYQPTLFAPAVPCLFILMECANGGNLEEFIRRRSGKLDDEHLTAKQRAKLLRRQREHPSGGQIAYLSLREILSLFLDICHGLSHLHRYSIVHRDLKPPNLLLSFKNADDRDEIPRVLISDFGECEDVAKLSCTVGRTGATGTLEFMAPELLVVNSEGHYTGEHSPKADLWSLGMVLYYLCYSELPYRQLDDLALLKEEILAFKGPINFPDDGLPSPRIPNQFKTLISLLLSHDPQRRPSVDEILSNARSVDFQQLAPEHYYSTSDSLTVRSRRNSPPDTLSPASEDPKWDAPLLQASIEPLSASIPRCSLVLMGIKMGTLLFPCYPRSARLMASVPLTTLAVWGLQRRMGTQFCLALVHASLLAFFYFATGSICGA
ncbi:putative serine/threonine-protein kinase iks1 [Massospora cicadina]|nr:putative serine/threonine-protein kinase iks1 [Massospora cicadina]